MWTFVSFVLIAVVAVPAFAQGQSTGKSNGNGNGHKSQAPSSSPLPAVAAGPGQSAASPVAWLDDASVLPPGMMAVTLSVARWAGTDLSEVDFPIVEATAGVSRRVQLGVCVPHVMGAPDGGAPIGGVGTSYIVGKIALLEGKHGVKLAASPMIEILGEGARQVLAPGESAAQVGLPISLEVSTGAGRVFASTGFFTRGVWFAGGGAAVAASPRVDLSLSFTRARTSDALTAVAHDRRELSGSASYLVQPQIALFGSVGHTFATADADGAGATISGGVVILIRALHRS